MKLIFQKTVQRKVINTKLYYEMKKSKHIISSIKCIIKYDISAENLLH